MRNVAVLAAVLVVAALSLTGSGIVHAQSEQNNDHKRKVVEVKRGDSLSKIAKKNKTTYPRIYYANPKVEDPDLVYPGDKLEIPKKDEKLTKRPLKKSAPVSVSSSAPKRQTSSTSTTQAVPRQNTSPRQAPVQQVSTAPAPRTSVSTSVWDRLADCESSGNWSINTGNGYYGGLQFSLASWRGVGGTGYPHQASKAEQINRAEMLLARQGWGAWPACTAKMGLR